MPAGGYDARGIWQYGEDDPASPFSDTLNLLAESTSVEIGADRARLDALEDGGVSTSWTPNFTNATVGNGSLVARYARVGDLVAWSWKWTLGTIGSTVSGAFGADLPTAVDQGQLTVVGSGYCARGTSPTGRTMYVCRMNNTVMWNGYADGATITNPSPFTGGTWVSGDVISAGGVYMAA